MASGTRSTLTIPRAEVPLDRFYRLSVDQYHRMAEAGILTTDDGVELLEGVIYLKHPASYETSEWFYRLSVGQYHELARLSILTEDEPVELLQGWLITKMTKNTPHIVATKLAFRALEGMVPDGWHVAKEDPVTAVDSEPEPDLSIVRGEIRDYLDRKPGPRDVALVVEVADSSLAENRTLKKQIYSRAGFSLYWIVNLAQRQIEVYSDPSGPVESPDYRQRQDYGESDAVPLFIEGREVGRIAVRDLLP
jgi:Uma2 family endonuclease